MADFGDEVRRFMAERGLSLRGLAKEAHYDASLLSKVLSGQKPCSPYLAGSLDRALGAGGQIESAARQQPPKRPRPGRAPGRPSRAVEALQAVMTGDAVELDIARDGLTELVSHYAMVLSVAPSAAVYDDLLSVRSFAGSLLARSYAPAGQRADLVVTAGWLSSLLSISAADIGDHAAALVWCADTERRGRDAGYPELLGWAALTRALIAYHQGQPGHSAAVARRGQESAPLGTVAHARLAAHEMRSLAMLGDAAGMADARRRATAAVGKIAPATAATGVYSIPRADDPPYTATSLLLVKRYHDAAETTCRLIERGYSPQSRSPGDQPTKYARTLLILALAEAGLGRVDEASAAGSAALGCGRLVWPTMVLAGKLDQSLARSYPKAAGTAGYHARYLDAGDRVALPGRRLRPAEGPA